MDGYMSLMANGDQSTIDMQAAGVSINTGGAYLQVQNSETGGSIIHSATGESACISLETPTETIGSNILVTPKGILLAFGLPETLATIGLTETGLTLSVGPSAKGAMIEMTAGSILLKVGETEIALTPDGIVSKAPLIESSCQETKHSMGPQGIRESLAEVSRSLTPAGHALSAAEAALNIGVTGVATTGPTNSGKFDAAAEVSAAMLTQAANGMSSQKAPVTTIG
jgi:hypothetical protein